MAPGPESLSILVVTRNRPEELRETLKNIQQQTFLYSQAIVVENGSDGSVVRSNAEFLATMPCTDHLVLDSNHGVWGGRNEALRRATGDFLLEIDDDAVFENDDAIDRAVTYLRKNPGVGILAFRIINYHTRAITPQEYPFRDKRRDPERTGPCAWFIGAGHLIRREVIEQVGLYRRFHPWGSEEQDLAMRAMDRNFEIHYFAGAKVLHKKSPRARVVDTLQFGRMAMKNRVKVALLNLPWYAVMTYFIIRGGQFSIKFRDPRIPLYALLDLWRDRGYIRANRKPLQRETLQRLWSLRGPMFY